MYELIFWAFGSCFLCDHSLTLLLQIGLDVCSGSTDDYKSCKLKIQGLLDGKPSSEALGYYCEEHGCHKCGAREEMDYCRKCVCADMSCYSARSDKYKTSVYCTPHTCTKCHARSKAWDKTLCVVCR